MNLAEIQTALADFESRYAEVPVRIEAGELVHQVIRREFFSVNAATVTGLAGLPITFPVDMPQNAYDIYFANGACRRYYLRDS